MIRRHSTGEEEAIVAIMASSVGVLASCWNAQKLWGLEDGGERSLSHLLGSHMCVHDVCLIYRPRRSLTWQSARTYVGRSVSDAERAWSVLSVLRCQECTIDSIWENAGDDSTRLAEHALRPSKGSLEDGEAGQQTYQGTPGLTRQTSIKLEEWRLFHGTEHELY